MDTNILEDFLKLAETRSFTRAAVERHITQPAFSRRIRMLEDFVGAELIDRSKSPIELTPAGVAFEASAGEILDRLQTAKDDARALDASDRFHVNLAFSNSVVSSYLPIVFSVMQKHVDSFRVNAYSDSTEHCVDSLVNGDSHFLSAMHSDICPPPERLKQFPYAVLSKTQLVPVSKARSDGTPLYKLDSLSDTLIPFLTYASDSYLLQVINGFIADRCEPSLLNIVLQSNYSDSLTRLVIDGRGLAWLPEFSIRSELRSGTLVPAADNTWNIPLEYRMYGRGKFSPLVEAIVDDLRNAIEEQS